MNFYTNLTFKVQKGRGLWSRDPISKFQDPPYYNFWTNRTIRLIFSTRTDALSCVWTTKRPLSRRGLGHVTQFQNFGTPYNFWTNRAIHFKFGTRIEDGPVLRVDHKRTPKWAWPGSRDPISKFWDPNWPICFKFGTEMQDGSFLCINLKMTHKWAWSGSRDPISKI